MGIMAILLIALPLILLGSAMMDGWSMFSKVFSIGKRLMSGYDKQRMGASLSAIPYYQRLSVKGKALFLDRVLTFMFSKTFEGKNGLKVTDEMKIMISASAVQLTFGLKRFRLENIETIYIYPETFYLANDRREFKGGTSSSGNMHFSWKDFREGYTDDDDNYNLGLHEMSHALKLSVLADASFDARFGSYLDTWLEIADKELERIKHGKPSFLRSYAKTNRHEFFAVCVEHFFENPEEFKTALPDIYNHLAVLLNQNPLNTHSDYYLDGVFINEANKDVKNIPLPKEVKRNFKYSSANWAMNLSLFGGTVGLLLLNQLEKFTVIPFEGIVLLWLICSGISLYIWKHYAGEDMLGTGVYLAYCLFGPGVFMSIALLGVNYLIPVSSLFNEKHPVHSITTRYMKKERWSYTVHFSDLAFEDEPGIRTFSVYTAPDDLHAANEIEMDFRYGIFGLRTLRDYRLIRDEKHRGP